MKNPKSLYLNFEDAKIRCMKCDFKPHDKSKVLQSLQTVGTYDSDTGEYLDDDSPVKNAWEVVVLNDDKYIMEDDDKINISSDGLYFFCPDCIANPKNVID